MTIVFIIGLGLAAYLLGSIPNGFLVARSRGIDIRTVGSGNIGATNVFRVVSKPLGILTFALDALKGWIPTALFPRLLQALSADPVAISNTHLGLIFAAFTVVGHTFTIFMRFKGGKGVATSAGSLLAVIPMAIGIGFIIWVIAFAISRYVSLASILAVMAVGVASWFLYFPLQGVVLPAVTTFIALLIVWLHRANIRRLAEGTEHRFEFKKSAPRTAESQPRGNP